MFKSLLYFKVFFTFFVCCWGHCCCDVLAVFVCVFISTIQQHPFDGPLSGTTRVSRCQKDKTSLDLLEQEIVSGGGVSWALCKSAPHPRQMTTPASHRSVFYRPDALPAARPTASKH